jgi:TatA/E family protein of Tat protein translocase
MGSLGFAELAFIFVLALLIFGPKKLPEIGRTLGRGMAEFRKASNELKRTLNTELALDETPTPPSLRPRRVEQPEMFGSEPEPPEPEAESPREAPAQTEPRATISRPVEPQ